jgi:hypothetical protein
MLELEEIVETVIWRLLQPAGAIPVSLNRYCCMVRIYGYCELGKEYETSALEEIGQSREIDRNNNDIVFVLHTKHIPSLL